MSRRPLLLGAALALLFSAAWVALTAVSGKTYHLAPLLIAATPGWVLRWAHEADEKPLPEAFVPSRLVAVTGISVVAVASGWLAVRAGGADPGVTIVPDLPGGTTGEAIAFTLLGLFVAARSVSRAACRRRSSH